MSKVRYSKKAVEDLSSIWRYTVRKWSEKQADRYYQNLIFYKTISESDIFIIRILHEKMDIKGHLQR